MNPLQPLVTVLIVVRNEAEPVERCLRSMLEQTLESDRYEVLVVDGMSTDGTRKKVGNVIAEHPERAIRLLDNPRRILATGWNIGIRAARGEIIVRVDAHATVATRFLQQSLTVLQAHPEAWCVGGPVETVNTGYVGRAIAGAMSSPVGVGNARFRLGNYEGYVDTIAYGAYWRWVFDKIGLLDEELVRNQDDDLNLRLILAGGKIYMTPDIQSRYFPRTSLGKLARQYSQYGFWRVRTIQKHRQPASLRQIVPLAFVLVWLMLLLAPLIWPPLAWGLAIFAAVYVLGLLAGAADVMRRVGAREALLAPLVFAILHFGYGLGSLAGLVWFLVLRRGAPAT
jgi:succinoglycan biosynthesis protein ExoA